MERLTKEIVDEIKSMENPRLMQVETWVSVGISFLLAVVGSVVIYRGYNALKIMESQVGAAVINKIVAILSGSLLPFIALSIGCFIVLVLTILSMRFDWIKLGQRDHRLKISDFVIRLVGIQQDENLAKISSWLHDSVSNELVVQKMDLEYCIRKGLCAEKDGERMKSHLDNLINETRNMLNRIYPRSLSKMGLVATLKEMIDDFESRMHVPVKVDIGDVDDCCSPELALFVCKIIREGLANIAKHSNSSFVELKINCENNIFSGCLVNNNVYSDDLKKNNIGIGLLVISEHARRLGGDIQSKLDSEENFVLLFSFRTDCVTSDT